MISYNAIDLDKVKEKVADYCAIIDSYNFIIDETVPFNPLLIRNNLKQTDEALKLLNDNFLISFDGIENINDIFKKADKEIVLNSFELLKVLVFHNHCQRIKKKIDSIDADLSIKEYSDSINIYNDLALKIDRVVDPGGNIKEDASDKLKDIFYKINKNISDIHKASESFISRHNSSLQEPSVFYRNDRVTFLLKNSDKNKYNGYQYGSSASGLATYVEPEQFIELNNRMASLENEKIEEVNRILRELTYVVSKYSDSYIKNFDSLIKLDVVFAKAEYGFNNSGIVSSINNENRLYLKDIAHPLIDQQIVVCNTYTLEVPYKGIVISGTNTGGKTVGLKVIGLSVLMSYLGIPLLCSEASIPLYNNVYIDIDDNQSIFNALSTFSSHISNINEILNKANENSLILIDELISGTDPKEAQAISLAILEKIIQINSYFVITTHYDDIKQYAYNHSNIMLSSVGFDLDNLKPTYKYLENSVGVSNAIDIASRFFDDASIIENSRKFLNLNKTKEDELLDRLAKEIQENIELKENLDKEIIEQTRIKIEYYAKLDEFNKEKEELRKKYNSELNDYIDSLKEQAKEKLDSIEEKTNIEKFIKDVDDFKVEVPVVEEVVFEIGDSVRIGESSQNGDIVAIDGDKVSVNINGMIIKTKLSNLTKLQKKQKQKYIPKKRMARVSRELNLVGERVEDAIVILDNYLDNAYGGGLETVKIIHGFGTGQLRKGIREHLKKLKFIASFENGDAYDGGSNVTIVKFK